MESEMITFLNTFINSTLPGGAGGFVKVLHNLITKEYHDTHLKKKASIEILGAILTASFLSLPITSTSYRRIIAFIVGILWAEIITIIRRKITKFVREKIAKEDEPATSEKLQISRKLFRDITKFLMDIPGMDNSNGQRAFIYSIGLDAALVKHIHYGPPIQFVPLLLKTIGQYGDSGNRRNILKTVLESTKDHIGEDKRAYCEQLIQRLIREVNQRCG